MRNRVFCFIGRGTSKKLSYFPERSRPARVVANKETEFTIHGLPLPIFVIGRGGHRRGLGYRPGGSVAPSLAAEGWSVALVGRRAEALAETESLAGKDGGQFAAFPCDIGVGAAVAKMAAAVLARFRRIDALVNAAGFNVVRRSFAERLRAVVEELVSRPA